MVKGASWAFAGKIAGGVGSIVLVAVLARMLDPVDLGSYLLALSVILVAAMVTQLGLERTVVRLVAEANELGRSGVAWRVITQSFFLVAVSSVCVGVIFWLWVGPWLASDVFHSSSLGNATWLLSLWIPSFAFQSLISETFRGLQDIRLATTFSGTAFGGILSIVVYLIIFGITLIVRSTIDLEEAIALSAVANWVVVLCGFALLSQRVRSLVSTDAERLPTRSLLQVSSPLWISNLGLLIMSQADLWVIGAFRSEEEVAVYGVASRLVRLLSMLLIVANEVMAPIIAELYVRDRKQKLQQTLQVTAAAATMVAFPIYVAFILFGETIIGVVYGPYYGTAALFLVVLSTAQLVSVWTGSCGVTLMMTGQGKLMMAITVSTSVAGIVGSVLLVSSVGALGVAVAIAGATALQRFLMLAVVRLRCDVWAQASATMALRLVRSKLLR